MVKEEKEEEVMILSWGTWDELEEEEEEAEEEPWTHSGRISGTAFKTE